MSVGCEQGDAPSRGDTGLKGAAAGKGTASGGPWRFGTRTSVFVQGLGEDKYTGKSPGPLVFCSHTSTKENGIQL